MMNLTKNLSETINTNINIIILVLIVRLKMIC